MSMYDGGQETIDIEAEIERRTQERVKAEFEARGMRTRSLEEVNADPAVGAEIDATNSAAELHAVLAKHGMLREHD